MSGDPTRRQTRARASGIEAIRSHPAFRGPDEPLGEHDSSDHLALICESREQRFEAVVPFIEQGLARDERCLYVADTHDRDEVLAALRAGGIDVDRAVAEDALRVRSTANASPPNGAFDPDEAIEFYADAIETALAEYESPRVTLETGWIASSDAPVDEAVAYETRVTELIRDTDAVTLCQYDRNLVSDDVLSAVIETHPIVVYERTIAGNVYYTPPAVLDRNGESEPDRRDPDRMLERLLEISDALLERRAHGDFLRDLHLLATRADRSVEDTLPELLRRGCDRFGHELGVVARIDPDTDRFEVEYATDDHEYFRPGTTLPLSERYCTAVGEETPIADVPEPVEADDSDVTVVREFGLRSHLGTYVPIDGGRNRLLFFVRSRPVEPPVSDAERTFHFLLGRWVKFAYEAGPRRESRDDSAGRDGTARLTDLVLSILETVVEESTRSDVEREVCERVAAADPYEAAWICERSVTGQCVSPSARAGIDADLAGVVTATDADRDGSSVSARALDSREPEVARVRTDPAFDHCRRRLRDHGIESVLATPIEYEDLRYGVLAVCAGDPDAFDRRHRDVLAELGEGIGFAFAAANRKAAIASDEIVELEFRVSDPEFNFSQLTTETDATVTLDGFVMQPGDSSIVYATTTGASPDAVRACAAELDRIRHVRLIDASESDGRRARFEFVVPSSTIIETLAEYGAEVTRATAADGEATIVVALPQRASVRAVVNAFRTSIPGSEVVAKRTRTRSAELDHRVQRDLQDVLTEKQYAALRASYYAGYFDRPRETTGNEIAETLDISSSTFHQHLQTALQKLLSATLEDRTDRPGGGA